MTINLSSQLKPAMPEKGTINMSKVSGEAQWKSSMAQPVINSPESLQETSWGSVWTGM